MGFVDRYLVCLGEGKRRELEGDGEFISWVFYGFSVIFPIFLCLFVFWENFKGFEISCALRGRERVFGKGVLRFFLRFFLGFVVF